MSPPGHNAGPAPANPPAPERRCRDRYPCLDGGVLRLAVRPALGGRRALLVDLSTGGVGFLLDRPLEPGAVLALELCGPGGGEAQGRVARVAHCRPHPAPFDAPWLPRPPALARLARRLFGRPADPAAGQAWLIGCTFSQPLSEAELRELVGPQRHPAR
jgi:hypothetical protein